MVSVQSEVCGIMDNQKRKEGKETKTKKKCFHAQGNFFCTSGSFYFMFLCCQWCCVWMLNILKIKPNVGRRRVYLKREKKGDILQPPETT